MDTSSAVAVTSGTESAALEDWPWYEVLLSAVVLTVAVVFTASSVSHMGVGWKLRKDLSVAVR